MTCVSFYIKPELCRVRQISGSSFYPNFLCTSFYQINTLPHLLLTFAIYLKSYLGLPLIICALLSGAQSDLCFSSISKIWALILKFAIKIAEEWNSLYKYPSKECSNVRVCVIFKLMLIWALLKSGPFPCPNALFWARSIFTHSKERAWFFPGEIGAHFSEQKAEKSPKKWARVKAQKKERAAGLLAVCNSKFPLLFRTANRTGNHL